MRLVVLLVLSAALAAGSLGAQTASGGPAAGLQDCKPTESQGAGPIGTASAVFPRRTTFGKGYVLSGKVLRSFDCKPLKGAIVEIWQAGKNGRYTKAGRASVVVGASGTFRFEGPRPGGYEGRPGHIHMRIYATGYEDVLLTHFPAPGKRSGQVEIVMTSLL